MNMKSVFLPGLPARYRIEFTRGLFQHSFLRSGDHFSLHFAYIGSTVTKKYKTFASKKTQAGRRVKDQSIGTFLPPALLNRQ